MESNRVEKYQSYRQSLFKDGAYDFSKDNKSSKSDTTTLPLDEVMPEIKKSKSAKFKDWIVRNSYFLRILAIAVGLCIAIIAIILWIITIWRS